MSSITGKVNSKGKLAGSVSPSSGVKNYEDLAGLPSINGVQLIGDKTTEDLKLEYVVHVTGDEESGFVADKTNAEINELRKRGFNVTLKVAGRSTIYELLLSSISNAVFQSYIPRTMRIDQVQIMLDNVYIGEMDVVPSPTVRGGVKADAATENDTVPVKFNSEDGRAYASLNVAEKTEADTDYTSEVKIDPETRKLYNKQQPTRLVVNLTIESGMSSPVITADKTFDQIRAAIDNGLDVICITNADDLQGDPTRVVFRLSLIGEKYIWFATVYMNRVVKVFKLDDGEDMWSFGM